MFEMFAIELCIFRQIGLNGTYVGHCLGKWIHRSENFDDGQ